MADTLAHCFQIGAFLKCPGDVCVALIVDADVGNSGIRDDDLVLPPQVAGMDGRADVGREDEVIVMPRWTQAQVFFRLTAAMPRVRRPSPTDRPRCRDATSSIWAWA